MSYDGFISYSHAADGLLAPRLQSALQRFAKPWWERRAVRIFRDESSLSANPHLWSSITEALDTSGWFVLLLSPDAAQSEWVNQEIGYWVTNRDPKKILPVVTDGTFGWADGDVTGDAVPDALRGVFSEEPRWVDLRFAKDEEQLDLNNPTFSAAVADVASAIRGIPKDELESEEVRRHRQTVRTAWAAGGLVTLLAVAALGFGIQSARNADEAERLAEAESAARADADASAAEARDNAELARENAEQADIQRSAAESARDLAEARELAAAAIAVLDSDPELATLLAIAAIDSTPAGEAQPLEVVNALWRAGQSNRLAGALDVPVGYAYLDITDDGRRLLVTSEEAATVTLYDAQTLEPLWEYTEETVDSFTFVSLSPDGSRAAVSVLDSTAQAAARDRVEVTDDRPNRIVILDVSDGSLIESIEYPDCAAVEDTAWSPDGAVLVVGSGFDGCDREGTPFWAEVIDTVTWSPIEVLEYPNSAIAGPAPRFDDQGTLYLLGYFEQTKVYESGTYRFLESLAASGMGDVAPDGSRIVASNTIEDVVGGWPLVFDATTGNRIDVIQVPTRPSIPLGVSFSTGGEYIFIANGSKDTLVVDAVTGETRFRLPGGEAIQAVYSAVTGLAYTAHLDGTVKAWDLSAEVVGVEATGDLGETPRVNGNSFRFSGDLGAFQAFQPSTRSSFVRFFDLESGDLLDQSIPGWAAVPLVDGRLAVGSLTEAWRIYDPTDGSEQEIGGCTEDFAGACPELGVLLDHDLVTSVDGSSYAFFGFDENEVFDGSILGFDPISGLVTSVETTVHPGFRSIWAFTTDWVLGHTGGSMVAVDRSTGATLWEELTFPQLEIAPSAARGAVIKPGSGFGLLDFDTWDWIDIPLEVSRIRGLAFSPDERRIAVADAEALLVVDVEGRAVVQRLALAGVSDAHWLGETKLVVGTEDGTWGTVSIDTDSFLESTRASLRRSFTDAECVAYRIDPCPTLEELRTS